MEPVLGGRDDAGTAGGTLALGVPPQWSPSLADGTTGHGQKVVRHPSHCRNGARPWRTGRRDGTIPAPVTITPQWSPSLADGTTSTRPYGALLSYEAAMEPVLGGRDDSPHTGYPKFVRNAAMEPVLGGRDDAP